MLVHDAAARRSAAVARRGGRVLVSGLPRTAYRATHRRGAGYAGNLKQGQRAVRKNRIISRLAFGPLLSV